MLVAPTPIPTPIRRTTRTRLSHVCPALYIPGVSHPARCSPSAAVCCCDGVPSADAGSDAPALLRLQQQLCCEPPCNAGSTGSVDLDVPPGETTATAHRGGDRCNHAQLHARRLLRRLQRARAHRPASARPSHAGGGRPGPLLHRRGHRLIHCFLTLTGHGRRTLCICICLF